MLHTTVIFYETVPELSINHADIFFNEGEGCAGCFNEDNIKGAAMGISLHYLYKKIIRIMQPIRIVQLSRWQNYRRVETKQENF